MRKIILALLALSTMMALVSQPVMALPLMSIPYVSTAGGFTFAWPHAECGFLVTEFNNTNLARFDTESFALSFTPRAGDTFIDESAGSPVLAQTSGQRARYDRTYFFSDTSSFI